jgi:hypothetical protein
VIAAALAAVAVAAPATPAAPASDFFVSSLHKKTHYGKVKELVAGRKKSYTAYLRFASTPTGGRVVLRLLPIVGNPNGLIVRRAKGGRWNERTAAFATAPLLGGTGVASGPLTKGQWAEIDVSGLVSAGGAATFGLVTTSQSPVVVGSRESGPAAPQLTVQAR